MSRFRLSSAIGRMMIATMLPISTGLIAGELPPIDQRFTDAAVDEIPHFQKHVVPLLGRLGCNGRACHGSFQGRGDFRLSLFGYDFAADHQALTDPDTGRVDLDDVAESLIIAKPTDADAHEGGKRFDLGSWQHHVLRRWIENGATNDRDDSLVLETLEISPAEILFTESDEQQSLTAMAHWSDGTTEDVTPLCRFRSNDDAIAAIDETGHVTAGEKGDTHVVVFYDNAVTCVPVIRPLSNQSITTDSDHPIDRLIAKRLNQIGIEPSSLCSDADFVRRAALDITGLLPQPDQVRAFLQDAAPDKRERLVNELLATDHHAAWWATKFCDWTGNNEDKLRNALPVRGVASNLWHQWLQSRIFANVPYDEIVAGIVGADSREPGESYLQYCESMSRVCRPGGEDEFADRSSMPLYWARQEFQKPEERAIGIAYAFLGIRIECAQCHKHPFDKWSKDDFDQFSKLFTPIRTNGNVVAADAKKARQKMLATLDVDGSLKGNKLRQALGKQMLGGETVPFGELVVNTRGLSDREIKRRKQLARKGGKMPVAKIASGKILGGETVTLDTDPRDRLVDWMRSEDNPYFATALVNRVWAGYFGIGIVDPTDDLNLANPPSNEPLLQYLADEFIAHDFDLRWLHREIVTSHAYQRSTEVTATNRHDRRHFSRHVPHRLPAEVIDDAIRMATSSDQTANVVRGEIDDLSIADAGNQYRKKDFALEVFGKSKRESNCDCDRSDDPSLLQAVYVRNDIDIYRQLNAKNGWVTEVCRSLDLPSPVVPSLVDEKTQEKIEARKSQITKMIKRYKDLAPSRQAKARKTFEKTLSKMRPQARSLGIRIPSFDALLNNPDPWNASDNKADSASAQAIASDDLQKVIDDAYLRTLSRYPDADERSIAANFLRDGNVGENVASLMWTLLNTKEFVLSH